MTVAMVVFQNYTPGLTYATAPEEVDSMNLPTQRFKFTDIHKTYAPQQRRPNSYDYAPVNESGVFGNWSITSRTLANISRQIEVRHIGFLKVHKAASSTMQNIFFRFGMKRNLTFVFTEHPNYFSRQVKSHIPLVRPRYRTGYDILCNHAVFDHTVYSSLLPEDTVYLAIVRDPVDLFISAVNYYSQKEQLLSYLAAVPGNKVKNLIQFPERYDRGLFSYTRNVMARDFGFPVSLKSEVILNKMTELDKVFKLVLVVEYFEESLILMKRYLNWKLQDILFISNNVYKKNGWSLADLGPDEVSRLTYRNQLDFQVYDFFYEKFWRQFRSEPEDIHMEVLHFKGILTKLSTFCESVKSDSGENILFIDASDWNEEFMITAVDCEFMKMDELVFIKKLRAIQGSEIIPRKKVKRFLGRF